MTLRAPLLGLAAVLAAAVPLAVGCGGGSSAAATPAATESASGAQLITPKPAADDANRFPRGSSVGTGLSSTPPKIAAAVRTAAAKAGCTVRAFPAEATQTQPDGTLHVKGDPRYTKSLPPASGLHNEVWADWGVYDTPVPFKHQVHNLEHGGIVVHFGRAVSVANQNALRSFWAKSPAYILITPETFAQFPPNAVVLTSWQRWMVCKPFNASRMMAAITTYRDTYRGTGPEAAGAIDSGVAKTVKGLPQPVLPDLRAQQ